METINKLHINWYLIAEFIKETPAWWENFIKLTDKATWEHVMFHHSAIKIISSLLDNRKL